MYSLLKIISLSLLTLSFFNLYSQKKVATFEDGTKIEYDMLGNNSDEMNKFNVYLGGALDDRMSYLALSYFKPDKFFTKANLFGSNYNIEALIFLNNLTIVEDKPINLTLKNEAVGGNTILRSQVKENLKRKTYYGIHGGYAYKDFSTAAGFTDNIEGLVAHEVAIGFGRIKGRYVKWAVEGRKKPYVRRGTSQSGIYLDALFYPVRSYSPSSPSFDENGNEISVDDITSIIGGRLYLDGRTSFVGKGDWGFHYRLGAGYGVTKKVYPIISFGIYFGVRWIK